MVYSNVMLNPVRANMVAHPAEYRWSGYRANARGEPDASVQPHFVYDSPGCDASTREAAYRELFRVELEPGLVDDIRRATNGNFALGSVRFADKVTAMIGRRAMPEKSGRPRKPELSMSGKLNWNENRRNRGLPPCFSVHQAQICETPNPAVAGFGKYCTM